ncbi:DUF3809 family protein [Thermus caliditerrae]|uniref:DUF3809 family protein n=1 Tax=Thermus caliditerrae TaxID=1330700 RepID=UPI0005712081|nr:DUF3809 family protein [Thermus caliditerrae]
MRARLVLNPTALEGLPPFLEVQWEGNILKGALRQENPVLGEVVLPFACRMEGQRLTTLPLPPPSLTAEGWVRPSPQGPALELWVELVLPEGRSWGERAFGRILEALFLRALGQMLPVPGETPV